MPIIPLAVLFLVAFFLIAMIQIEFLEIAFAKLGLTPEASMLILVGTLLGSGVNLPIYSLKTEENWRRDESSRRKPVWELFQPAREGKIVLAVNMGGCVIPVGLCLYFISRQMLDPWHVLMVLSAVTAYSYKASRLAPGVGVRMPILVAPLIAAVLALILEPDHAARIAYVGGVLGVLIGADILHLRDIGALGAPVASIGGAGTFDGIFLTGVIAALLA